MWSSKAFLASSFSISYIFSNEFPPNKTTLYLEILRYMCITNYSREFTYELLIKSSFLVKPFESTAKFSLKEYVNSSQLRLVAIITFMQYGTAYTILRLHLVKEHDFVLIYVAIISYRLRNWTSG